GTTPQTANTIYAGPPTTPSAAPAFRLMVSADLPATALAPNFYWNESLTALGLGGAPISLFGAATPRLQVQSTDTSASLGVARFSANANPSAIYLAKSRGAAVGTQTIVQADDQLGAIVFSGSNGTNFINAAQISAYIDGTPGASNDMPGRLSF